MANKKFSKIFKKNPIVFILTHILHQPRQNYCEKQPAKQRLKNPAFLLNEPRLRLEK